MSTLVVFFDIDGTLVNTRGAGRASLDHALAEAFQLSASHDVPVTGRTDRAIAGNLFELHGIEDSTENWERFRASYLQRLPVELPRRQGSVLPGIGRLLERLNQRNDTAIGLLTGNVRDGARIKLEYFGLFQHFAFGGFGDVHRDRDDVAREALAAWREHLNGDGNSDRLWVIGDTPLDIRCARAIGARVVAVATGSHRSEELAPKQPDLLLDDLSDTDGLLERLLR